MPQPPERCLSRKAGIVRCCLNLLRVHFLHGGLLPQAAQDVYKRQVLHTLHCMVLCGMDDQNFVVADPLDFNRVVPRVQFMRCV